MDSNNTFRILGIGCSPRRGGNSDLMVEEVLRTAADAGAFTEFLRISDKRIRPCDACWSCAETNSCHIRDDMQGIYPMLLGADAIVIGSPVHMGYNVSGQAQVFFDRTFSLWHRKRLGNKVGGAVVSSNRRGGTSVISTINQVLLNHHMIIAGYASGYGNAPGDVREDPRAFREAAALGERLGEVLHRLKT